MIHPMIHHPMTRGRFKALLTCAGLIAGCSAATLAADNITGVARNQTRHRPAAGDEVILLRLDQPGPNQSLQEEERTRTDQQGRFSLAVRYPEELHSVRVVHQGVDYDQRAAAGEAVSIDVFDAIAKVQGVTGTIEIIRAGTNGNLLHVSDLIEIKNDSNPPLTQAGERTFEVYLPAHAKIDSVLAAGPGNIGGMIAAAPVAREPGHYTVNFPLRPGASKIAFNYDLPYDGQVTFHPKSVYPVQQLAVMIPPTMRFTSRSPAFQPLKAGNNNYQVEAASRVNAGERPTFEISGDGALPAVQAQTQSPPKVPGGFVSNPVITASAGLGAQARGASARRAVSASPPSSSPLRWWMLRVSVVLASGAFGRFLLRRQRLSARAMMAALQKAKQPGPTSVSLVSALKEELFQLEIDRLHGTISGEDYDSAKQALEGTVRRALARAGTGGGTN
jgi:hypothetical protein